MNRTRKHREETPVTVNVTAELAAASAEAPGGIISVLITAAGEQHLDTGQFAGPGSGYVARHQGSVDGTYWENDGAGADDFYNDDDAE